MNDIIKEIIERVELNADYYKRVDKINRLIEKKRVSAEIMSERAELMQMIRANNASIASLFMLAAPNELNE